MANAHQAASIESPLPPELARRIAGMNTQRSLNRLLQVILPHASRYHLVSRLKPIYARLNEEEFKIAVVANMSSGKSSFINALFGDLILPAFHEATTGCLTYIFPHQVKDQGGARVHFNDDRPAVDIPGDQVKKEIKLYAQQDTAEKPDSHRNVDRIDLSWEFETFKAMERIKFRYVVIDTPGPNNTGHFSQQHKTVTNRLIREDADLVLFLFDYGQLDANLVSDQQGLWEIIKNRSQRDSFFDVLFIINKADLALEDDARRSLDQGTSLQNAVAKLRQTARDHGFESPDVYGVAAQYACLHKMEQKGLLHLDSNEARGNRKAYRKALIDFDETDDPAGALAAYCGIDGVEKRIADYIRSTVEQKVVSRVKWELEGVIKQIANAAQQRVDLLGQSAESAEHNLRQGLEVLTRELPFMRERLTGDFNAHRYDCLAEAEKVITACAEEYLLDPLAGLTDLACRAVQDHVTQGTSWPEAQQAALQASRQPAAKEGNASDTPYRFTTADPTVTVATLFGLIESFIGGHLDRARQGALNAYKLRLDEVIAKFVDTFNRTVSKMQNELNKELSAALGLALDSGKVQEMGEVNLPPMNFSIPLSCIETAEKERLVSVPDGYRQEEVKKQRLVHRPWYNPLRWVGKGAYLDEYVETENKAVFKKLLEKEYQLTIDPVLLRENLEQRIRQGVETWKENDTLQLYISLDQLMEQYIEFLDGLERDKKAEIYRLREDLADQERHRLEEITHFDGFREDLKAALTTPMP